MRFSTRGVQKHHKKVFKKVNVKNFLQKREKLRGNNTLRFFPSITPAGGASSS
jgi:hypothetical protein